ncbi:hypothetical protein HDV02_005324 [Globomyces sp. JEL0801]|nr:hypothetical protein HDV02_005324 [Globomyces sp. JEL0801]
MITSIAQREPILPSLDTAPQPLRNTEDLGKFDLLLNVTSSALNEYNLDFTQNPYIPQWLTANKTGLMEVNHPYDNQTSAQVFMDENTFPLNCNFEGLADPALQTILPELNHPNPQHQSSNQITSRRGSNASFTSDIFDLCMYSTNKPVTRRGSVPSLVGLTNTASFPNVNYSLQDNSLNGELVHQIYQNPSTFDFPEPISLFVDQGVNLTSQRTHSDSQRQLQDYARNVIEDKHNKRRRNTESARRSRLKKIAELEDLRRKLRESYKKQRLLEEELEALKQEKAAWIMHHA